ncbi:MULTISPECIES: hypothetical protein [Sorangium]|uniref:Uncharacterized protein n=1 Tax=Sorangium cellulosum TaxID=56 RepID=A0A4P2QK72_SORCE|nr:MULTISPECIES: hypothetical protein [Sorangium]AUX30409.1 uncharacterized protein SOCE836_025120 [Sorangium cellulosum]WCQ89803.1 hypothetical protein NQZ70_02495 [Sorangium sp. Soce836]
MKITFEDGNTLTFTSGEGREVVENTTDVINVTYWLWAFASPRVYSRFSRVPPRDHVLRLLDIYISYVEKGGRVATPQFQPVHYERRLPLAMRLRELLEQWTQPELPQEIVDISRALIENEGIKAPACGWDAYEDPEARGIKYEDSLLWPEGVPAILKGQWPPKQSKR